MLHDPGGVGCGASVDSGGESLRIEAWTFGRYLAMPPPSAAAERAV
jgi:hypothetical protein